MIRLSKLTDYGLLLLTLIARDHDCSLHTARDLAQESRLPLPTVSKILKVLLQSGLLTSHRGIKGGYSLARQPDEISVAEVIASFEGEIAMTACSTSKPSSLCDFERWCPTKANQRIISQAIRETLERVTLSDLVRPLQLKAIQDGRGNYVSTISPLSRKVH
jgi:FeS assembly SUF system regulator